MKKTSFVFLLFLSALLFYKLLAPYYLHSIYQGDAAGHAVATQYFLKNIFPKVIGWNSDGFMGFPQNQFYPPLFSYLVSLISFLIGFEYSFRFLVSVSVVLLPFGFYVFARSLNLSEEQSLIFSVLTLSFLAMPSRWFLEFIAGGNFESLFVAGLVQNSLGLLIFLFYLANVPKIYDWKYFFISTVLLSALVLTHLVTAFVGIVYAFSFFVAKLIQREKVGRYMLHFFVSFCLTAFWSVPFLVKNSYSSIAFIPFRLNLLFIIVLISCCLFLALLFYKKDYTVFPVSIFFVLMLFLLVLSHGFFFIMHTHRFVLFFYILAILLFVKFFDFSKIYLYLVLFFSTFAFLFFILNYTDYSLLPKEYEKPIYLNFTGRTLVISVYNSGFSVQTLDHLILSWNSQPGVSYVYIESSLNGEEVNGLKRLIAPNGFVWGAPWNANKVYSISSRNKSQVVSDRARLLGIDNIITYSETSAINYTKKTRILTDKIYYSHSLVEVNGEEFYVDHYADFFISRKTASVYKTGYGLWKVHTYSNKSDFFFKDDVLYDEFILCNKDKFYFLSKQDVLDYNSYVSTELNLSEIDLITNRSLVCSSGVVLPEIFFSNKSFLAKFSNVPVIEIMSEEPVLPNYVPKQEWKMSYYLYELSKTDLVEPIREKIESLDFSQKEWNNFIFHNFFSENYSGYYVKTKEVFYPNDNSSVRNVKVDREKIFFTIDADKPSPVLIKVSYFPNWRAYQDGKRISLYQISPHFMMVNAKGNVEIKYENTWSDNFGIFISLFGLLLFLFLIFYQNRFFERSIKRFIAFSKLPDDIKRKISSLLVFSNK